MLHPSASQGELFPGMKATLKGIKNIPTEWSASCLRRLSLINCTQQEVNIHNFSAHVFIRAKLSGHILANWIRLIPSVKSNRHTMSLDTVATLATWKCSPGLLTRICIDGKIFHQCEVLPSLSPSKQCSHSPWVNLYNFLPWLILIYFTGTLISNIAYDSKSHYWFCKIRLYFLHHKQTSRCILLCY